ncbi:MAG: alpha/beta hydrolase [Deltaproteobacteria bacterium]|nr:alpha/beta hydrolase [Deltaproteobacteria bacterium]
MTLLQVKGPAGNLNVDDGGYGGLPVVFIHSAGGNTTHWAAQLAHVRKTRRALALDLRGHGLSQPPRDGDYRLVSQTRDIDAVVNQAGIRNFVLVGHSMGGSVSVAYAGFHPDRVSGLLMVDTGGDSRQFSETQRQQIIKAMKSDAFATVTDIYWGQLLEGSLPEVYERVMNDMKKMPKEMVISQVRELFLFDPKPSLSRYQGPKLAVVTTSNDTKFSLHRLHPGFPRVVVKGTGHWIQLDRPDEFNRILDGFLAQVDTCRQTLDS